ncbi:MAG: AAA family ATPase [Christensenellaceae bacterium]|nr:AAA family ATPase [Christensenellaceae bacterium]
MPTVKIDSQIHVADSVICRHIENLYFSGRGAVSQDILAQLRNFVEHIMLKIYANGNDIDDKYDNITKAIAYVKTRGDLKLLRKFHNFLQIVASHYTLDEENSERLMLKYYEYLLKIKNFMKNNYNLEVLWNLEKFPINTDSNLKEYYEKIAERIDRLNGSKSQTARNDRYYIQKIKPFFVRQKIYYEVTFTLAYTKTSKFDRIIAFTNYDISQYYAAKLYIIDDSIQILEKTMPIYIIVNWEVSIRSCEIENFSYIIGNQIKSSSRHPEYRGLMHYLTVTGFNLIEIIEFTDSHFEYIKQNVAPTAKTLPIFSMLEDCRKIILNNEAGANILRYLLYHLTNKVIKDQWDKQNNYLSNLRLSNGCIPFDKMPFNTSLLGHNPRLGDLFDCIDSSSRKHELFARLIRNNTEIRGQLYTPSTDIVGFNDIDALMQTYNSALWSGHAGRRLEKQSEQIYIQEYRDDTLFILNKLKEFAAVGMANYTKSVEAWLFTSNYAIDSSEKKTVLEQMFEQSTVALIYGSAGTGKSTMINHVSHFFSDKSKLYLANTNPAVDNLKRRITASNCTFSTIAKFLKNQNNQTKYDLLIIDECSTVNNRDMRAILEKVSFDLLILVGDIYQIESIRFGNWFSAAKSFMSNISIFELTAQYRSKNKNLQLLWNRVRQMDDTILELITRQGYSVTLDASIFQAATDDEIILCLNYDGLYGINNINRFLQQSNPSPVVRWGVQYYKVNDPVLFNESERFAPLIYNNMKGKIVNIEVLEHEIQFDIELDKVINSSMDTRHYGFELLGNDVYKSEYSVIRFTVSEYKTSDDDDDTLDATVVPFQVAYAISIHKAQGLEYNSVKIVITNEIDELITHNIFYTAITRAREQLRIYWTPEVEQRVLSSIKPRNNAKDIALLRAVMG